MQTLLEELWFVLAHLAFSLSAERNTKFDKLNHSFWKHFSGNQFVCFIWQFINSPDLMFCPQDEKCFKIWGWFFTLWGPRHLSQPVTCGAVFSQSLQQFLVPWENVQSANKLETATGDDHGWVWPTRAIVVFFLFSITKKCLIVSCNKFPLL